MEDLPDAWTLFWQVVFCAICEDTCFHFSHKLLHWRRIYPYIHKIHHKHISTISIASQNAHPIEYIFGNLWPVMAGPLLLGRRMHVQAGGVWAIVRMFESYDAHSGYEFPWSPFRLVPFACTSTYHNFHHSHNISCYSTFFTFWDHVFGTNKEFYQWLEKKQIEEKKLKSQ